MYKDIQKLADTVGKFRDAIVGEQHTKNVLIEPILRLLGFEITDPFDIVTEYSADFGTKRGEKVDYALFKDKELVMLVEAKDWKVKLEQKQISQLFRYFSVSSARVGVLTNGIEYMFFTDTQKPNTMDMTPFFTFNLLDFDKKSVEVLGKFHKNVLNVNEIDLLARTVMFRTGLMDYLKSQAIRPSDDFVTLLSKNVTISGLNESTVYKVISDSMRSVLEESIKLISEEEVAKREVASTKAKDADVKFAGKLSGLVTLGDFNNMNSTGTKPIELFFVDAKYPVRTWAEVLVSTVHYALSVTDEQFVLNLDGSIDEYKGWVRKNIINMQTPKEVGSSGIFVDTCASATEHVKRIKNICRRLEITETDVLIQLK